MSLQILSRAPGTLAIAILATGWLWTPASAQSQTARTVLTLHFCSEAFPGIQLFDAGIRDVLRANTSVPVNYYAEYLESEEFPAETASTSLRDYIQRKFEGRQIDVVITSATPALQFALQYREDLFPGVPIVFSAGLMPEVMVKNKPAGITGVINDVSFAETVQLALTLHPSAKRLFVVAQSPSSSGYDERVRAALDPFSKRVELTYIRERSVPRLLATLKTLPPQSLIFYTRYTPEDAGRVVYPDEVARLMAQASPAPIYVSSDVYMGSGIVGGAVRSGRATATRLGEIANQILGGAKPEDIPIGSVPLVPMFDWRQVKRWGIDPSRLPPGSEIYFRTPTLWESYRFYIIGALIVVVAQLFLIAALLAQRARRRRAEDTIRAREVTLRTSYERIRQMAGRLINAQEAARAGIARDLHDDVCQQLVYVSMGVNALKGSSGRIQDPETQEAFTKLEDETNSMFDGIRRLSHELHPSTLSLLGLAPTLKTHCSEVEKRHNVQVSFKTEGEVRELPLEVTVCMFRIAQEALRNAVVHGEAQRLAVHLVASGGQVELTVTDDGLGFDPEIVRRDGQGLGLVSMEERAHAVGAEVEIVSGLRKGTVVRVRRSAPGGESSNPDETSLAARPRGRRAHGARFSRSGHPA
jgi:signal transduction histidine kinase